MSEVSPWPTDRVQVGLQVLLLEEAGYTVPRAELYDAAEKHRLVVPVDEQLRQDALDTLAAAKACAVGPRPLPLVNDPKCPRCSLQSVCLPDEINFSASEGCQSSESPAPVSPRKLWPPRDDGIHLVAQKRGTHVGVRGSMMRLSDDNGATIQNVPLANVESLSLLGSVQISTQAMQTLADRGIPIALLSAAGRMIAIVDPLDSVSADTRRHQVRQFDQPQPCLTLARALISAQTAAGCLFSDAGRKAFFTAYGCRMSDEITHPVFGYKLSYRRMLILHARMIAAWLNGEVPTLAFLTTR